MTQNWYVLRSKPNREEFLEGQLSARGIEVYYPRLRAHPVNPRARRFKPYFPGYLFVRVDLESILASNLERIPGTANLVTFGGEAPVIPGYLMEAIRTKVDEVNTAGEVKNLFIKPGTAVRIERGPFEGYEGIIDVRIPGKERVRVLLDFLQNRKLAVELPVDYVDTKREVSSR
jgi:transcriptional antiterminator RfaH